MKYEKLSQHKSKQGEKTNKDKDRIKCMKRIIKNLMNLEDISSKKE